MSNYGYIDKTKVGLVGELDRKENSEAVTTFADDIGALAAAAAYKVARQYATGRVFVLPNQDSLGVIFVVKFA